jgi:UDP-glucose 4-epimerase
LYRIQIIEDWLFYCCGGFILRDKISTILVTGGAGLIGSAVVRNLLELNKKVVVCDNFSIGIWHKEDPKVVWIKQDIVSASLLEQLGDYSVDAVIHCAAHPGGRSLDEPEENV